MDDGLDSPLDLDEAPKYTDYSVFSSSSEGVQEGNSEQQKEADDRELVKILDEALEDFKLTRYDLPIVFQVHIDGMDSNGFLLHAYPSHARGGDVDSVPIMPEIQHPREGATTSRGLQEKKKETFDTIDHCTPTSTAEFVPNVPNVDDVQIVHDDMHKDVDHAKLEKGTLPTSSTVESGTHAIFYAMIVDAYTDAIADATIVDACTNDIVDAMEVDASTDSVADGNVNDGGTESIVHAIVDAILDAIEAMGTDATVESGTDAIVDVMVVDACTYAIVDATIVDAYTNDIVDAMEVDASTDATVKVVCPSDVADDIVDAEEAKGTSAAIEDMKGLGEEDLTKRVPGIGSAVGNNDVVAFANIAEASDRAVQLREAMGEVVAAMDMKEVKTHNTTEACIEQNNEVGKGTEVPTDRAAQLGEAMGKHFMATVDTKRQLHMIQLSLVQIPLLGIPKVGLVVKLLLVVVGPWKRKELWEKKELEVTWEGIVEHELLSKPAIGGELIYACANKEVVAFRGNGTIAWRVGMNQTCQTAVAPVIDYDGRVYVVADQTVVVVIPPSSAANSPSAADFFSMVPTTSLKAIGNYSSITGLAVTSWSSVLYINTGTGLHAFMFDGTPLWSTVVQFNNSAMLSPKSMEPCAHNMTNCTLLPYLAVDECDGSIYIARTDGWLFSFATWQPFLRWSYALSVDTPLSVKLVNGNNGRLYAAIAKYDMLYALSTEMGTLVWQAKVGPLSEASCVPSVDSLGFVSVGSLDGFLYVISPDGAYVRKYLAADNLSLQTDGTKGLGITQFLGINIYMLVPSSGQVLWSTLYPGLFPVALLARDLSSYSVDPDWLIAITAIANLSSNSICESEEILFKASCTEFLFTVTKRKNPEEACMWGEDIGFTRLACGQTSRYLRFLVGIDLSSEQQFELGFKLFDRSYVVMHMSLAGRALVVNQVLLARPGSLHLAGFCSEGPMETATDGADFFVAGSASDTRARGTWSTITLSQQQGGKGIFDPEMQSMA
ncbi:hypothetical protein L7F22_063860 [Adiantum nelumboides]|nr:hypothetical protein [Adiantum nelumboides]